MKSYQHLSPEERALIMIEYNQGKSIRFISYLLNRSPSTISREIKRNLSYATNKYCATTAAKRYQNKRSLCIKPPKLMPNTLLYNQIKKWLIYKQWSPEQISGALSRSKNYASES